MVYEAEQTLASSAIISGGASSPAAATFAVREGESLHSLYRGLPFKSGMTTA